MKSLTTLLVNYHSSRDKVCGIRLGQYFCNKYIRSNWPQLFYCQDDTRSIEMITQWLVDNCYENSLPDGVC